MTTILIKVTKTLTIQLCKQNYFHFHFTEIKWITSNLKQYCVEIGILWDLAPPTVSECNTTVVNKIPGLWQLIRRNVGADYKQNASRHDNILFWKLVSLSKDTCIVWSYPLTEVTQRRNKW